MNERERKAYEALAEIEHQRWSDWQRYMHSLCERRDDGSLVIPADRVAHWERQIATDYADLSEREKDMDREQVDHYWWLVKPGTEAMRMERRDEIGNP